MRPDRVELSFLLPVTNLSRVSICLFVATPFGCGATREPAAQPPPELVGATDQDRISSSLYERARVLEEYGLLREAIGAYTDVLDQFGEYKDSKERRQQLADALGMSLAEIIIPERPTAATAQVGALSGQAKIQSREGAPRLPPRSGDAPSGSSERETRWIEMYGRAKEHERAHRYLTAIDVYTELLDGRGSYRDAALRRSTLVALHRLAEQLYARGVAAASEEEAQNNFEQIEVFWPEFRDIADRLAELREN